MAVDVQTLSGKLRTDWDSRIRDDYRYWMADGWESDGAMWATGERDFGLIGEHFPSDIPRVAVALEVGCGVGRLLRAAAKRFTRVVGMDIAPAALERAMGMLRDCENVELLLSEGEALAQIADHSVDLVYSFAVLGNIPAALFASLLCDMKRILKPNACAVLQVFIGHEQEVVSHDTLAYRSYELERLAATAHALGLELEHSGELVLPFEVSDRERGIVATIVRLRSRADVVYSATAEYSKEDILRALLRHPEHEPQKDWPGSQTAYLMALSRAERALNAGDQVQAIAALELATKSYADPEGEIRHLLSSLKSAQYSTSELKRLGDETFLRMSEPSKAGIQLVASSGKLDCLSQKFPGAALALAAALHSSDASSLTIEHGASGLPVLMRGGYSLDQKDKPEAAAQAWVERQFANPSLSNAERLIVVGFAGGYHIQALMKQTSIPIVVLEPSADVLKVALEMRDQRNTLTGISDLAVGKAECEGLLNKYAEQGELEFLVHPQTQAFEGEWIEGLKRKIRVRQGLRSLRPSIGVVGPMYGGSLPIARYVAKGFAELKQRSRLFDFDAFFGPFQAMDTWFKDKRRAAPIQATYVEMLSQLILESLDERPIDILIALAQAPLTPRLLTELRARGIVTAMWFVEDGRRFPTWKEISRHYDYMFVIQKEPFISQVRDAGAGSVMYLPLGVDADIHAPGILTQDERNRFGSDVSFVGAGYNNRRQMFASLANFDFKIWGNEWPGMKPFDRLVQERGRRISPEEYVKIFNASKVNLNLHSSSERDGVEPLGDFVNPRTFELAGCGAFQLVDKRVNLPELFEYDTEVATFETRQEMVEKIDYYLAHPEQREAIAQRARERALKDHTYGNRLSQMLEHILSDRYDQLKSKMDQGPWPRTLKAAGTEPELKPLLEGVFEAGEEPTLDSLVGKIQLGKGKLSEAEMKILLLYHFRSQITNVSDLRQGARQ